MLIGVGPTNSRYVIGLTGDGECVGQTLSGSSVTLARIGDDEIHEIQSRIDKINLTPDN